MLWPEWKDSDLNNEKWEIPKGELFLDTEFVTMPRSLEPDRWIRAKDLKHLTVLSRCFLDALNKYIRLETEIFQGSLTVYTSTAGYPDLITNNKHLLHSEVFFSRDSMASKLLAEKLLEVIIIISSL